MMRLVMLALAVQLAACAFVQAGHASEALAAEAHQDAGCAVCAASANSAADVVVAVPAAETAGADEPAVPYAAPVESRHDRHADTRGPPAPGQ